MARIQVSEVSSQMIQKEIMLQGKVVVDERNVFQVSAPFSGRIDQLWVDYTGAYVKKDQVLADLYSPELITAQTEFFDATSLRAMNPSVYIAARNKLRRWNIPEKQIEKIENSGVIVKDLKINSPVSGTVIKRNVTEGQYVNEGTSLLEVANLGRMWVVFDAYEEDLPWLNRGDEVNFTIPSVPGKQFSGKITFIDPLVNPATRTVRVRIEVVNHGYVLKPEMFAYGWLYASDQKKTPQLTVPKSSVLWTGRRSLVYVSVPNTEKPTFQLREVTLGPNLGEEYAIINGLEEGEKVVTYGAFKIDAAAQLAGKRSMMNLPEKPVAQHHLTVPEEFSSQLEGLAQHYFDIKNALVETDAEKAKMAANHFMMNLGKIESKNLPIEVNRLWQKEQKELEKTVKSLHDAPNVDEQRVAFEPLSDQLTKVVQRYLGKGKTFYIAYCPMAFDNAGAAWLSEFKEIRNPYFGDKMMTCGVVKGVIGE
ncbi:MAG: efflux RND transporter periplasmic adaptor subunit [Bacteroidia bacterium]